MWTCVLAAASSRKKSNNERLTFCLLSTNIFRFYNMMPNLAQIANRLNQAIRTCLSFIFAQVKKHFVSLAIKCFRNKTSELVVRWIFSIFILDTKAGKSHAPEMAWETETEIPTPEFWSRLISDEATCTVCLFVCLNMRKYHQLCSILQLILTTNDSSLHCHEISCIYRIRQTSFIQQNIKKR